MNRLTITLAFLVLTALSVWVTLKVLPLLALLTLLWVILKYKRRTR